MLRSMTERQIGLTRPQSSSNKVKKHQNKDKETKPTNGKEEYKVEPLLKIEGEWIKRPHIQAQLSHPRGLNFNNLMV